MSARTRGYAHRVDIAAGAAQVWQALTDTGSLRKWCSPQAQISAREGGHFRACVDRVTELEAHIDVLLPQRRMRLIYLPSEQLPQSGSAIETRRTTGDLSRRCGREATGWKASDGSGRGTTEGRTAGAQTGRRTTGTEAWRRTSKHRRRTRRRAELRQCGSGRCDGGTEQHARGQGDKSLSRHCVHPLL